RHRYVAHRLTQCLRERLGDLRKSHELSAELIGLAGVRRRIEQDPRANRAGVAHVDEGDALVGRGRADELAVVLDAGRLAEGVLHEQARLEDRPPNAAALEPLFDREMAATDDR